MSFKLDSKEYNKSQPPMKTVKSFFEVVLTELGWKKSYKGETIMDVGCGPGKITKNDILPFFQEAEKLIAIDILPDMIDEAKKDNADPKIEYVVADIANWSTLEQWDGKIQRITSIHCLHWVKDQKLAFENIQQLLVPDGEAALFFVGEATFFDALEFLQKSSRWSQYLEGHDNKIPASHFGKYEALHFKDLAENVGFEVRHCVKEERIDIAPDETYKNYLASLCCLLEYIPKGQEEDFKDDLMQETLKRNGRKDGRPYHKGQMIEIVIKKKPSKLKAIGF